MACLQSTLRHVPGHSLLLSNGEDLWWEGRHVLGSDQLDLVNKWRCLVERGTTNIEMFDHVTLMTLDSLLKCVFSYNSNCQQSTSEYVSAIVELSDLIIDRRLKILHHWDWFYWRTQQGKRFKKALSIVHRFTREVVQKRRALIKEHMGTAAQNRKKDFVDIILLSKDEDGQGLTDEEIQAEANTFMFAGHDTTASAICWTLYNLARHDHYQEKCRQEVMDLMQGRERYEIQWEDLSSLPFTTMCIRESLRLHAPVQAVTRRYTQDMPLPRDCTVPRGAICLVSIYGTHHNPAVWTNPHVRNEKEKNPPLVFLSAESRASHAFIPFSSGPRNCIGQKFALAELRVVVALTLLRFRLTPGVNPKLGSGSGGVRRLPQLVLRAEGESLDKIQLLFVPADIVIYAKVGGEVVLKPGATFKMGSTITWKEGENLAMAWDGKDMDLFRQFKERGSLNNLTGEMTLTRLNLTDSGWYTPEVNQEAATSVYLKVISPVPQPTIRESCDAEMTACTLTCDGGTPGAEPLNYTWWSGDTPLNDSSQTRHIRKEDSLNLKEFRCVLQNPVSQESSESFLNPFTLPPESPESGVKISTGLTVFISLLAAVLVMVLIHRWKAGESLNVVLPKRIHAMGSRLLEEARET
ncbi:hypothetical protein L3Q82_009820, partial [Scortum barcoo]